MSVYKNDCLKYILLKNKNISSISKLISLKFVLRDKFLFILEKLSVHFFKPSVQVFGADVRINIHAMKIQKQNL